MHGADDAHPHTVARTAAGEAIRRAGAAQLEVGAEDPQPAQRRPDGHPKVLARDFRGRHPFEHELVDAARAVPRRNPHVAQRSLVSGGRQRSLQVGRRQFRAPRREAAAGVVLARRQVRRIWRSGPDGRRELGAAAAGRAVINGAGTAPSNSTSPAVAFEARSVSALAVRITWQCVWSHRSNPSASMFAQVRGRVSADRDRERFESGRRRVRRRLAGQDPGHVGVERQDGDAM